MAGQKNFEIDQGATFYTEIEYLNGDDTPIDLEGCTAKMQVRNSKGGGKIVCTLTTDDGIALDTETATFKITIAPEFTKNFYYPKSSYDLVVTDTNNNKTRILEGYFSLSRSTTL